MTSPTYAAVWQNGGPPLAGQIQLEPAALSFDGAGGGLRASFHIPYATIAALRLGRGLPDRIGGRPALVLDLVDGETIRIATPELGALHELAEALLRTKSGHEAQRDDALVDDRAVLG